GTYIKASSGFEMLELDNVTDNASGTAPAPVAIGPSDIERSVTMMSTGKPAAAYYYQIVTTSITDKLMMYDWSPAEFAYNGHQYGFGMAPSSAKLTAGASCNGGTTQPTGMASNPKEVLVGTELYGGFKTT